MDNTIPYEKPPPYSPTAESSFPTGAQNTYQQSGNPPYPQQPPPYPPQVAPNTYQQYGYPPYPQPQPQPTVYPIPGSTPLVNTSVYPPPSYGGTTVTINPRQIQNPEIIIVGGCPICRVGVLEDEYPCVGIMCAILFFPLGILCCLAMREKRCSNCGVQLS